MCVAKTRKVFILDGEVAQLTNDDNQFGKGQVESISQEDLNSLVNTASALIKSQRTRSALSVT
jgi:hypothetical protein